MPNLKKDHRLLTELWDDSQRPEVKSLTTLLTSGSCDFLTFPSSALPPLDISDLLNKSK